MVLSRDLVVKRIKFDFVAVVAAAATTTTTTTQFCSPVVQEPVLAVAEE
jgi:hypothetical protein